MVRPIAGVNAHTWLLLIKNAFVFYLEHSIGIYLKEIMQLQFQKEL